MGTILSLALLGIFVGGLGRWAVPGPDPMPLWLTLVIGYVGIVIGGGIGAVAFGQDEYFPILLIAVAVAALLVVGYRRFVQRRPVTGPEAMKLPTRGIGVRRMRERLQQLGVDPNALGRTDEVADRARRIRELRRLHDDGVLTDEEYEERVRRLDE